MSGPRPRRWNGRARVSDIRLVGRQLYYEQLTFWLNPFAAVFTIGFSVVFLVLLGAAGGTSKIGFLHGVKQIQYYVPVFAGYGVMSACFNMLAITLVVRRETGLLKRLRLSPLPTWVMLAAVFLNVLVVSIAQVVVLLLIGKFGYQVHLPTNLLAFAVAVIVGALCFTAVGIAASTLIPNQEAAGPIVSIVFFVLLFLSGLWYPLKPGSGLAQASAYFPIRHLLVAMFIPFEPGVSPWAWHDLLVMAIWGVASAAIALRRFRWEPRRS
ncbi:MAG: ABC transporter permease [Acidimicrobiales bacterium]